MASSRKPTIVLVSGAWCVPEHYEALTRALEAAGFTVHVPPKPTCSGARPPTASYSDDVQHIRTVVAALVEAGEDVIMLMHSYGGAVGTDAVRDLTASSRNARGLSGGVVHLLYLCAYMQTQGRCVMDVVREGGGTEVLASAVEIADDGTCMIVDPVVALCHDFEDAAEQRRHGELLVWFPVSAMEGKLAFEAWREVPATYVRTEEDRCVPPAFQDIILGEVRKTGVEFREISFQTSHAVYAIKTREIVELVQEIAGSEGQTA